MFRKCFAACLGLSLFAAPIAGADTVKLVQELPRLETQLSMVVANGLLFSTNSRMTETESHTVQVLDAISHQLVQKISLPHNIVELHRWDDRTVIAIGKSTGPWRGFYSLIRTDLRPLTVKTQEFADEIILENFGGSAAKPYFAEPGSRSVFKLSGSSLQRAPMDISGPGTIAPTNTGIWVLERGHLSQLGDENLVWVNGANTKAVRIDRQQINTVGIVDIAASSDGRFTIVANAVSQKLLSIDDSSRKWMHESAIAHVPYDLELFGNCALTLDPDQMSLEVHPFNPTTGQFSPSTIIDISSAGDRLKRPRKISADPTTGQVFIRSAYPCASCSVTQSSVFVTQLSEEVAESCLLGTNASAND
jgi:hypothetical protein